ncbi:MAG: aspartate aminotransferase family protein [Dehalococcoidia bacterium]|nr:aspartate aminotransferase family protein [Dehalococcoidia bacterium]
MATDWKEIESQYYMHTFNRQPIVIERGEGMRVWDVNGKEYLDMTSGLAVNNLGHSHPSVTNAITQQAAKLLQMSNLYYTVPQLELAEALVENSCMDKVFFANSGAEANEGAIKLARKYGRLHRGGAQNVITTLSSFHGRTFGMIAATGQPAYQKAWLPLAPGFSNVPYDDLNAIQEETTDQTCAIMVEVLQGEGGVNVPTEGYLKGLREWCDEKNILLIFDEVQTGMGRLGHLWGYQHFGVEPDIMTLAKGLGNGVPIGAFLCKENCNVLEPGDHGSTFGGNVLATAAANATVRHMIEKNIPEHCSAMSSYLVEQLTQLKDNYNEDIVGVRGVGLLLALQFNSPIAREVVSAANAQGVLLNPVLPDAIRFMPSLIINKSDIDECITKLESALKSTLSGR